MSLRGVAGRFYPCLRIVFQSRFLLLALFFNIYTLTFKLIRIVEKLD